MTDSRADGISEGRRWRITLARSTARTWEAVPDPRRSGLPLGGSVEVVPLSDYQSLQERLARQTRALDDIRSATGGSVPAKDPARVVAVVRQITEEAGAGWTALDDPRARDPEEER